MCEQIYKIDYLPQHFFFAAMHFDTLTKRVIIVYLRVVCVRCIYAIDDDDGAVV